VRLKFGSTSCGIDSSSDGASEPDIPFILAP